jgi:DNA-binding transcriptional regulator YiaG
MREFAEQIGTHKFTVINWEVRGKIPRVKSHISALRGIIPESEMFLGF